jgi:hypothetical protein
VHAQAPLRLAPVRIRHSKPAEVVAAPPAPLGFMTTARMPRHPIMLFLGLDIGVDAARPAVNLDAGRVRPRVRCIDHALAASPLEICT